MIIILVFKLHIKMTKKPLECDSKDHIVTIFRGQSIPNQIYSDVHMISCVQICDINWSSTTEVTLPKG